MTDIEENEALHREIGGRLHLRIVLAHQIAISGFSDQLLELARDGLNINTSALDSEPQLAIRESVNLHRPKRVQARFRAILLPMCWTIRSEDRDLCPPFLVL